LEAETYRTVTVRERANVENIHMLSFFGKLPWGHLLNRARQQADSSVFTIVLSG
jgi:hypothetical protein